MKNIVVKYISGDQIIATSFELDNLSQIQAVEDGCYLYFTTVFSSTSLTSSRYYYGTVVYFSKTGKGYDLYSQIVQSISGIFTNPDASYRTIDFTWDPEVTVTINNMSGTGISTVPWSDYAVTWSSSSAPQPSLGNGLLRGYYTTVGKTVFVRVEFVAGTTTSFGIGTWSFSLPVDAKDSKGVQLPCSMRDSFSVNWYAGIVNGSFSGSVNSASIISTTSPAVSVDVNNPFGWGPNDTLQFNGSYEGI